ncbi:hypothetical protein Acsp02_73550 [Actinoplanes sp. NBRC 103695]|nr:hypothetical protein Acsp02_73550 [Actinoplanes sp. NBRC 103695]
MPRRLIGGPGVAACGGHYEYPGGHSLGTGLGYARSVAACSGKIAPGDVMSHIQKSQIVSVLRERGELDRADFVDRQLPDEIDQVKNASLLRMLRLDADVLAAATVEQ